MKTALKSEVFLSFINGLVYAAARNPENIDIPGVTPVKLDITNPQEVATICSNH